MGHAGGPGHVAVQAKRAPESRRHDAAIGHLVDIDDHRAAAVGQHAVGDQRALGSRRQQLPGEAPPQMGGDPPAEPIWHRLEEAHRILPQRHEFGPDQLPIGQVQADEHARPAGGARGLQMFHPLDADPRGRPQTVDDGEFGQGAAHAGPGASQHRLELGLQIRAQGDDVGAGPRLLVAVDAAEQQA